MKPEVTREDLREDAYSDLTCAVDLMNILNSEYFGTIDMPERWGTEATYERVSRGIRAVMVIINAAMDQLSVAESDGADDYFEARTKLMADIIRSRRRGIA